MITTNDELAPRKQIGQMGSKSDNDEVTRALSSIGNKLRKVGVIIPAIQEELSNKIEKKDLAK